MRKFINKFFAPKTTSTVQDPQHVHNWEIITKTYAPPRGDADGVTTILWKCACGEFKKEEMRGSDETPLEEILAKVESYGSQYLNYNGNIYLVGKYVQPQQTETLPLR